MYNVCSLRRWEDGVSLGPCHGRIAGILIEFTIMKGLDLRDSAKAKSGLKCHTER